MFGARCGLLLSLVAAFEGALVKAVPTTAGAEMGDELKSQPMTLSKSCRDKFFSVSSPPSDPAEMRTYIVLLRRYSTSRAALRVAATLQRLASAEQDTSGVRVGELSVMGRGEPSLVVETTVAGLQVLCQFSDVALIEEDQVIVSEGVHSGEEHEVPYHLDRLDQRHLPLDGTYHPDGNGSGVEIFIFDSGIRYDHEEFGGRALFSGFDPMDELLNQTYKGSDCFGHGTSVASCAVGQRFGTAPGAIVRSIRVMTCQGNGVLSLIYKALLKLIEMKEEQPERKMIVSMSVIVLSGRSYTIDSAVKRVHLAGIPVVVAAGNFKRDACHYSPVSSPYTISVGGSTIEDRMFDWNNVGSNYGPCVDVFAPATNILAAHYKCRDCSKHVSGTSFAAPMVSGLVAILLEKEPHLNSTQVKQRIVENCTKDALQFASQHVKDGTPNCLAYTPQNVVDDYKHETSDPKKEHPLTVKVVDSNGQGDDDDHNSKDSTETSIPTTVPTPDKTNQQPPVVGHNYTMNLSIPASYLEQTLMKKLNEGYVPMYVSNIIEPTTGKMLRAIIIFKKSPSASECKVYVNKRARMTRKLIKAARQDGYVVTVFHSYVMQNGKLNYLAVLEPKEFTLNFTSQLRYREKLTSVEATVQKMSALGYTVGSMSSAICGRVKPLFTLLSEHFGPEKQLNPPIASDPYVLLTNVDSVMVLYNIFHYQQKGYYINDIEMWGGCGNGSIPVNTKYVLLFHHMDGPSSSYIVKAFLSSVPEKLVEDWIYDQMDHFDVQPVMVVNTGKYYITQLKPL